MGDQTVRVAVRVRPFNRREVELKTKCVVEMKNEQTTLLPISDDRLPKSFTFDHSFDSSDHDVAAYASQEEVFARLGHDVLDNAFNGYNACIFAYGQTGSGKSYSMMGTVEQPGIIPRLCNNIFQRIAETTDEYLEYKVEVSYMEIYNERVRDLLDPRSSSKRNLKVREHKILGPMVDGLSELAVSSYEQISQLMEEGNKSRTVAATNMNTESSRSHAVFIVKLTQTLMDKENSFTGEKVAKISLVDLAGSERAGKSGAVGKRLEEGGNINKSLTTLGMVISALADKNAKKDKFVPYRDSVLTWLLKDSLGGNSRTVMIATVSPSSDNYEETLSTLRYADRAKRIVNHAVINEDPNARVIRELREEVETLRQQISTTQQKHHENEDLRERLAESERLIEQMNKSWEDRLKETDIVYKERQKDLADIGISIESTGIKVEKNRFYLVNLNADPSMNELLVYYINGKAVIGSNDGKEESGEEKVDIILQGLGVQRRHAVLEIIEENGRQRMSISPISPEARICVNGAPIEDRTVLRHGYRLLVGINHFFRVNCPRDDTMCTSMMDESILLGYDDAWHEANVDVNANPMTTAVDEYMEQITIKHQEDKQAALEQQYEAFERYIQGLTAGGYTPSTPITPFGLPTPMATPASHLPPFSFPTNPRNTVRSKFFYWAKRREELFAESLSRLKADIVKANSLVREANLISSSLTNNRPKTNYDVTLQIPAANLRPSKIKAGAFVCEPVVVVRRSGMAGCQLLSMEHFETKLVDMRERYADRMNGINDASAESSPIHALPNGFEQRPDGTALFDPFFETQENHSLIGVANVFLEVLFHDIKLDYQVPIISQQGEVAGRLHVEIQRVVDEKEGRVESFLGRTITCRVRIKRAWSLPQSLSHFVFCQYSFFNVAEMLVVAPSMDPSEDRPPTTIQFEHTKDFPVVVTEEFLEYVQDDALSIEVWGHRCCETGVYSNGLDKEQNMKTLQERWSEVTRRLELSVKVCELNENGQYEPVAVTRSPDTMTGGIYHMKQGQQRRIGVEVAFPPWTGSLPLVIDSISSVSVGCITVRSVHSHRPLDSYQEEDLERIRVEWTSALESRQKYLEGQINKMTTESEREHSLMAQWIALTEERTAVSLPAPDSDIPGAPSDWIPPAGTEKHIPVIFLGLNADDVSGELTPDERVPRCAGAHAILPKEHSAPPFIFLPFVDKNECEATCSWDSSLHEHQALNVPTGSNERVYAIVKVVVHLAHPCEMDVILRKRIALNIYKKTSLSERIFRRFTRSDLLNHTSVHYDIVAHLPKSSHEMEDRSSLAKMAARTTSSENPTDDAGHSRLSYIEAYTKSIQAVESMLKLDRLRQEVAMGSMLSRKERRERMANFSLVPSRMKRAVSLPNAITSPQNPLPLDTSSSSSETPSLDTSMCSSHSSMIRPSFLNLLPADRLASLVSPLNEKLGGIDEESSRGDHRSMNTSPSEVVGEEMNGNLVESSSDDSMIGECKKTDKLILPINRNLDLDITAI